MAYVGQRKPGYEVKRGLRASREVKGGEALISFKALNNEALTEE